MLILLALVTLAGEDYRIHKAFEALPEDSERVLRLPFAFDHAANGQTFVLDTVGCQVHVWNADGTYHASFGQKGAGPGELAMPGWIQVVDDEVWVWGYDRRLSKFDLRGHYLKTSKTQIRFDNFVALNKQRCVAAFKNHATPTETRASFRLTDGAGQTLEILTEIPNKSYLTAPAGSSNRVKAFPPDHVIQPGADGLIYFGFSQNKELYLVNKQGKVVDTKSFELVSERPTPEDEQHLKQLCFPTRTGGLNCWKDHWINNIDFGHDKAFYTHFIIRGGRIAFILTPLGGMRSGFGYRRGSFRVNRIKDGKALSRGGYELPEDSVVLHQRGRSLAFTAQEDGDYRMEEIVLRGLE